MFKKVPGTKDILPAEVWQWQELERVSRRILSLYNYSEIRTPIIEDAVLFNRSLGDFAEVVQKQMFLVRNKEDVYALRPEGTASIVRAYIENNLDKTHGFVKVFYMGPMFRLERPQKGRLRQFHHIGCEAIGASGPGIDIEMVVLADTMLKAFGISGYTIKLNSLGCVEDKKKLSEALKHALAGHVPSLCEECKARYDHNVLRILDCKNDGCREIVKGINVQDATLCNECKTHFEAVKAGLDEVKVAYEVSPHLVRGLDYYTRTVFEITQGSLGAQDAIGAGGRYDTLVKELGGPDAGCVGFAFGVERLLLALQDSGTAPLTHLVYVIPLGDAAQAAAQVLMRTLRHEGIACDTDYQNKSLKGAMRQANDAGARFVAIIGDDELKKGVVALKDMVTKEQKEIAHSDLGMVLKGTLFP